METTTKQGIGELLEKIVSIDYKSNPSEAFIKLNAYAHEIKNKIRPCKEIQAAEREIESVNWCINEILGFKNQTYDAYHESNFYSHQKRITEACHQITKGIEVLNQKTL